jgi:hypothetical protein
LLALAEHAHRVVVQANRQHHCRLPGWRYERKLWMRDLVKGVAYPPVDH